MAALAARSLNRLRAWYRICVEVVLGDFPMSEKENNTAGRAVDPSAGDRLDSWKEIAAYLKYSERTVRRWENEGLPIHRHPHRKKAAIYAFKPEIDAWWRDGRERLEHREETLAIAPTWSMVGLAAAVVAASLAGILIALRVGWFTPRTSPPRPEPAARQITANPTDDAVIRAAISPDGKYLAYTDLAGLHFRLIETGEIHSLPLPNGFCFR